MQDIEKTLSDIKGRLHKKISHPYLAENVSVPDIDEDKLLLLVSMLGQMDLDAARIENYTITTMLIQVALDTHEIVRNSLPEEDPLSNKDRQLMVLAGDYYSGLYYRQLAKSGDIGVIKTLAEGIKEINENKITVYQQDADGIDKLMKSIKKIESALFEKLSDYFHSSEWKVVAPNLLFIKRLINEKNAFVQSGSSIVFDVLKRLSFPRADQTITDEQNKYLMLICDRYIEFSKSLIETALNKMPMLNSLLDARMKLLLSQHHSMAKICVEEG
ncbi:heptaprenyl diphosphate synthase component 1 [Bacillus sp. T33-2]|uniref:heptaprenyl diphosphate synthase component 1 n=1 Tax=Bacillus sp. T33-2 TaxID=2054168 RepID=UPI000C782BC6|nr:heptaprenyl diphosphate synthase component 1 [Bacillus sp. T33-2]PLR99942.1 heptaprenyl diphosphate synthase [Bacillus sp. T33-2]